MFSTQSYPAGYVGTAAIYYAINHFFPPPDLGKVDAYDYYSTFNADEEPPFGIVAGQPPNSKDMWEEGSQTKSGNEVVESREV